MTNIYLNNRFVQYTQLNQISQDESKKNQTDNQTETNENQAEAGSRSTELGDQNFDYLTNAGLAAQAMLVKSSSGLSASNSTKKEYECNGVKFTVEGNGKCNYKYDAKTNKITFTGQNYTVTISETSDSSINLQLSGSKITLNSNVPVNSILNIGANNTINGSDGKDNITNKGSNAKINAGAGDDTITNTGANVTVNAGDGDDTISNTAKNVTVDGGEGSDSITNKGANATINTDSEDKVKNTGKNTQINEAQKTATQLQAENKAAFIAVHPEYANAEFTFDENNKVVSVTQNNVTVNIEYDNNGNLLNGTNSDGKLCQNGMIFSGVSEGLLYSDGVKFSGVSEGLLYSDGVKFSGVSDG